MPREKPRAIGRDHWIEILRSTGVQTGQSRLHYVKEIRGNRTRANAVRLRCISISVHCSVVTDARLMARLPSRSPRSGAKAGGADRIRTDDLKLAKLALSQLSYGPGNNLGQVLLRSCGATADSLLSTRMARQPKLEERRLVGPGRVERPTSRLSGVRSNHLSYEPETRIHGVSGSLRQVNRKTQATINTPLRACDLGIRRKEGKRRRRHVRQCLKEMFGFGVRPLRKHHP